MCPFHPQLAPVMSSWCKCVEVSSCCAITQVQDRLKIRKRGKGPDVMLGRQSFLNCGAYEGWGAGCDGGDPIDLFRFMVKYGLPDESCFTCAPAPSPPAQCRGLMPRMQPSRPAPAIHLCHCFCRSCTTLDPLSLV